MFIATIIAALTVLACILSAEVSYAYSAIVRMLTTVRRCPATGKFVPSYATVAKRTVRTAYPYAVAGVTPALALIPLALAGLLS